MVQKIKNLIQNKLNTACYKKYVGEVERQKDSYRQWYLREEGWKNKPYSRSSEQIVVSVPMQSVVKGFEQEYPAGIVLFYDERGELEEKAVAVTAEFFSQYPFVQIAYGDEDRLDETGLRVEPWFKPQWSPDTLDSFQYFGHIFAIRMELLKELTEEEWDTCLAGTFENDCYQMLLMLTKKVTDKRWIRANDTQKEIAPIGKVLLHMREETADCERTAVGCDSATENCGGTPAGGTGSGGAAENSGHMRGALISAVIPSKDNPAVLETCIASIRDKTVLPSGVSMEIIVVDNGSSEENRSRLEQLADQYKFRYFYHPMEFNFSRMCNYGIEKSNGDYILLLNDDMEIIQSDWLAKLYEKASLPHAGAVGAKLLYPDSDVIQHIGITNIKVGPVHKLLKKHDGESHYHGQNRHVYDMIGVTAACLLVARDKYDQAGGLYEEMAVAYNDVELNFALYELGYYNIERCDVTLYHHESLSRGDDNLSDEKWIRLLHEKDILYTRHPSLKGFDPFYSRNLAVHSNLYLSNFMYAYEKRDYYTEVKLWKKPEPVQWENGCLTVNAEHARKEKKLEFAERDDVYWIEGWSYVLGMDNCRYKRSLLLLGSGGKIYQAAVLDRYRKDVEEILPEQQNVALAGFVCRIPKDALPNDTYTVCMLASDRCSNQRLYAKTEMKFTVE